MSNQLITSENERIKSFFLSLERLSTAIEKLFTPRKPTLNGESFYTDEELSKKLKLSRRSLQDYRNEGRIPYIKLGGKILYRSSDIEKLLNDEYHEAFRNRP
ncbi:helix-turn-helix domain-containing protein [Parabacteroides sp. OttesenSCG-928-G07]|nr:helix-turn-helix domain-containing protein [Parabacteroides sp. OttesenSCG-928-G07]